METAMIFLLVAAALGGGMLFLRKQLAAKSRWGVGALQADCPRCRTPLPIIRAPGSLHETLWGGWTCKQCGCQVDKYGRERVAP